MKVLLLAAACRAVLKGFGAGFWVPMIRFPDLSRLAVDHPIPTAQATLLTMDCAELLEGWSG